MKQAGADSLLQDDLQDIENCMNRKLGDKAKLNENQYGALISWAFHEGCTKAGRSKLMKKLNAGDNAGLSFPSRSLEWEWRMIRGRYGFEPRAPEME